MTNLLLNHDFNQPPQSPTTLSGASRAPNADPKLQPAAAPQWYVWNGADTLTTTDVLPSTRRKGAGTMVHVCTHGMNSGLYQFWGQQDAGSTTTRSGAWVFVLRGTVGIGTGNRGDTHPDKQSTTHGTWEHLVAANGVSPANEFIVYATSADGACFYVDDATVQPQ